MPDFPNIPDFSDQLIFKVAKPFLWIRFAGAENTKILRGLFKDIPKVNDFWVLPPIKWFPMIMIGLLTANHMFSVTMCDATSSFLPAQIVCLCQLISSMTWRQWQRWILLWAETCLQGLVVFFGSFIQLKPIYSIRDSYLFLFNFAQLLPPGAWSQDEANHVLRTSFNFICLFNKWGYRMIWISFVAHLFS